MLQLISVHHPCNHFGASVINWNKTEDLHSHHLIVAPRNDVQMELLTEKNNVEIKSLTWESDVEIQSLGVKNMTLK